MTDNSFVLLANFPTPVNGDNTYGDYLSVFTTNYSDSPYIVNVSLTASPPDKLSIIYISGTIYLNPFMSKFIIPPYNNLKYV